MGLGLLLNASGGIAQSDRPPRHTTPESECPPHPLAIRTRRYTSLPVIIGITDATGRNKRRRHWGRRRRRATLATASSAASAPVEEAIPAAQPSQHQGQQPATRGSRGSRAPQQGTHEVPYKAHKMYRNKAIHDFVCLHSASPITQSIDSSFVSPAASDPVRFGSELIAAVCLLCQQITFGNAKGVGPRRFIRRPCPGRSITAFKPFRRRPVTLILRRAGQPDPLR
ncbi:hypothetical protein TCAP_03767 [Tolypocladium capitatum]|uniref:Uncharacterized protein n=1 Tax=Tolypocladium capitatum TaxID=45235 RepID=A0A2K3QFJ6_9HYPO|nr:hypothetical protein TCAP_03767 [Tolypocladium capitatum]